MKSSIQHTMIAKRHAAWMICFQEKRHDERVALARGLYVKAAKLRRQGRRFARKLRALMYPSVYPREPYWRTGACADQLLLSEGEEEEDESCECFRVHRSW